MPPQICLGSAQFGMNYGITNTLGQISENNVRTLLSKAALYGISMIDTAVAYGDSQAILGRSFPPSHKFHITSKLPAQKFNSFDANSCIKWQRDFEYSCTLLGVDKIDSFLLHNVLDLVKPGASYLRSWLLSLRNQGLVRRLGVSIYTPEELECVPSELLDLVQLPLSIYDQRFLADGAIDRLSSQGCAIHVRSIYLQGLLLSPSASWPLWISQNMRHHHMSLENMAKSAQVTLLDLALSFAFSQKNIEALVVGVCSLKELDQLCTSLSHPKFSLSAQEWSFWRSKDPLLLDPRQWPKPN